MTVRLGASGLARRKPVAPPREAAPSSAAPDVSRRTFIAAFLLILAAGGLLRGLFPTADPPWNPTVGIVWHDEGAWVHNARNKALFGAWSLDKWNPVYIAPVFTALEYASFRAFGVGVRQARFVPEVCGILSVWLLALGAARIAGRRAGIVAAALLATNYIYVMWNRTALMEGPMVAFMVASWYCYTRAREDGRWGAVAGLFAIAAFFTKASAAFFVAAVGLDAMLQLLRHRGGRSESDTRAAWWTLAGLAAGGTMDRLSVLQLADVGDAQAKLHVESAEGPRHLVSAARRVLVHVVRDGGRHGCRARARGAVARARQR